MRDENAVLLENIAEAVCQHRGLSFATQQEMQRCLDRTRQEILTLRDQACADLIEGLTILRETTGGHVRNYVSGVAASLLDNVNSLEALSDIIEKLWLDERSLLYFNDVIDSFYDCGDYHREHCLITVYLTLFPLNPQPYTCFGALTWRRDGIAAAERYYSHMIDVLAHPVVHYYAAECFHKNGNTARAKEVLQHALRNAEKSPDVHSDTKKRLRQFLMQL